uniref:Putative secreted protein n=1 Tax=Anopheles triannulatus TaxID=58253 RepID=A0A2M4B811_9DIPT
MPRSCDWGFLSNAAVLAIALRALAKVVLPESTWPRIPTLRFRYMLPDKYELVVEGGRTNHNKPPTTRRYILSCQGKSIGIARIHKEEGVKMG